MSLSSEIKHQIQSPNGLRNVKIINPSMEIVKCTSLTKTQVVKMLEEQKNAMDQDSDDEMVIGYEIDYLEDDIVEVVIKQDHEPDKTKKCEECGKYFRKWAYYRHRSLKHRNPRHNYKCKPCGETFTSLQERKIHKQTPGKCKSTTCPLCPRTFRDQFNMGRHVEQFHKVKLV